MVKELQERFGFNQSQIAKTAHCSNSFVSQVLSGKIQKNGKIRSPKDSTIEHLRRKLRDLTEPQAGGSTSPPDELQEQINELKTLPGIYAAARATIAALHQSAFGQPKKKKTVSSAGSGSAAADAIAAKLAAEVVSQSPEPPGAAGPPPAGGVRPTTHGHPTQRAAKKSST